MKQRMKESYRKGASDLFDDIFQLGWKVGIPPHRRERCTVHD
jgi:hypothetical protein